MRFERRRRHASEVNPGALIDIMFFLLLFFLMISTFTNPNVIKLLLPESSPSNEITKNYVTVSITKDLFFYLDKEKVTADQLENRMMSIIETKNNRTVILRVEKGVPVENMVLVLDIGMRNSLKIVLETKRI
ncbi:MAG: biopolymer transporter ExbD [Sphingobacteriia bacterium]|jgi:biopolymer transport protein ExbD|nr:biopolymer transporter ExbD [Sphingobacteriia bacterium]